MVMVDTGAEITCSVAFVGEGNRGMAGGGGGSRGLDGIIAGNSGNEGIGGRTGSSSGKGACSGREGERSNDGAACTIAIAGRGGNEVSFEYEISR